jgi:small-conductance mechanosensitive channel
MDQFILNLHDLIIRWTSPERISEIVRLILIIVIGFPLTQILAKLGRKLSKNRLTPQTEILIYRAILYTGYLILIVTVLNELGFKLSALLGAAGILGIAIGFASQTSVSNIISGIFLISEKPFIIGEVIQSGETIGTVHSIDLLSVKLHTFDNRFVRIPNEDLIKARIFNISRLPIRAVEIKITLPYQEDLKQVTEILKRVAISNPLTLKSPEVLVLADSFTPLGIVLIVYAWTNNEDYAVLKSTLISNIYDTFRKENISFPATPPTLN